MKISNHTLNKIEPKLVETSRSFYWNGRESMKFQNEWMTFLINIDGKEIKFDVEFDLIAHRSIHQDSGDYYTPISYWESDVDISVSVNDISSEEEIEFDMNNKENILFLENLVNSNLEIGQF